MRLHSLELSQFRGFRDLHLAFDGAQTVALVGANGAGKSTVLDALAFALSWLPARLRSLNGNGQRIRYQDIRNNEFLARVRVTTLDPEGQDCSWTLERAQHGSGVSPATDLAALQALAQRLSGRDLVENRQVLPDQSGRARHPLQDPQAPRLHLPLHLR